MYCTDSKGVYLVGGKGCFIKELYELYELYFGKDRKLEQEKIERRKVLLGRKQGRQRQGGRKG